MLIFYVLSIALISTEGLNFRPFFLSSDDSFPGTKAIDIGLKGKWLVAW